MKRVFSMCAVAAIALLMACQRRQTLPAVATVEHCARIHPVAPPPGKAALTLTIAHDAEGKPQTSSTRLIAPLDGTSIDFRSGRQPHYQTRINQTTTISLLDAGLHAAISLHPRLVAGEQRVLLDLTFNDNHVVQQLGIPFRIGDHPLIDTNQCRGRWELSREQRQRLCAWTSEGARPGVTSRWSLDAVVTWEPAGFRAPAVAPMVTEHLDIALSFANERGMGSERTIELTCDLVPGLPSPSANQPVTCDAAFGKQVPLVTDVNATRTVSYVDSTAQVSLRPGGPAILLFYSDNGLQAPPDLERPALNQMQGTSGTYALTANERQLPIAISRDESDSARAVTLTRFLRTPAVTP